MNFVLHGHAVSGGITIGYAHLVTTARLEVVHYEIPDEAIEAEVRRFDAALHKAREELSTLKQHIPADAPQEFEAFLNLHRMILDDSALAQAPKTLIRERNANAEWFFNFSRRGDIVEVTGTPRPPNNDIAMVDWKIGYDEWRTGSALYNPLPPPEARIG